MQLVNSVVCPFPVRCHLSLHAVVTHQFMSSFSQNTQAGPEVMVVPTNVLDRWGWGDLVSDYHDDVNVV